LLCAKLIVDRFVLSTVTRDAMLNPLFRHGIVLMSTVAVVAVAFLFVENNRLRIVVLGIAAVDLIVTPQILKRAAKQARD
jgi:hypothetical protein